MSAKQKDVGSSLTLDIFCACNSGFVRLIFVNFLNLSKVPPPFIFFLFCKFPPFRPPFNFFDILQQNGRLKIPKGPPFTFFGTMRLTGDFKKNSKKSSVNFCLNFFQYFDIVRLFLDKKIPAKVPPSFFLEFCGRMDLENYQKVPLSVFFGIVRLFFLKFFSPNYNH